MLKRLLTIYLILFFSKLFAQAPGNISNRLQWWFKANDGISLLSGKSEINSWKNFGIWPVNQIDRLSLSTSGFPKINLNRFNFNPGIQFSNDSISCLRPTVSDIKNMLPTAENSTVIITFKSKQKQATTSSLHYYSPTIFTTETAYTTLDYSFGFADGKPVIKCDSLDTWTSSTVNNYDDDKCKIVVASRSILPSKEQNSFFGFTVNGNLDVSKIIINNSFILNGNNKTNPDIFYGITLGAVVEPSGKYIYSETGFEGDIAEIIVYDYIISEYQLQKVSSYLAIKYGVTLNQSTKKHYYASNDAIIWNADKAGKFNYNITGIGQDDNSALLQPKSKSDNDSSFLTISNPSDLQNLEFLTWADNGLIYEALNDSINNVIYPVERRIEKIWQVQNTGNVGNVDLEFDLTTIPGNKNLEDLVLIVDSTDIFKNNNQQLIKPISLINNKLTFSNVDLSKNNYFTIGTLNRESTPLSKSIIPSPKLIIYQLISPNNDNVNDNFKIENIEYFPENEIFIYNHEGNLVFQKSNFKNGNWNCNEVVDGHYYYIFNSSKIKTSGTLLIQR